MLIACVSLAFACDPARDDFPVPPSSGGFGGGVGPTPPDSGVVPDAGASCSQDFSEPNDTAATAAMFFEGLSDAPVHHGTVHAGFDVDWFQHRFVPIDADRDYVAELTGIEPGADYDLSVWARCVESRGAGPAGTMVTCLEGDAEVELPIAWPDGTVESLPGCRSTLRENADERVRLNASCGTSPDLGRDVFVRVAPVRWGDTCSPYRVAATECGRGADEPNDTIDTATALAPGFGALTREVPIHSPEDVDWLIARNDSADTPRFEIAVTTLAEGAIPNVAIWYACDSPAEVVCLGGEPSEAIVPPFATTEIGGCKTTAGGGSVAMQTSCPGGAGTAYVRVGADVSSCARIELTLHTLL